MAQNSTTANVNKRDFLRAYNFTEEDFKTANLEWSLLEQIYCRHMGMVGELQTTANYISQRLQSVSAVHSLNVRIKHGEHLIAKIIRKRLSRPDLSFEVMSYEKVITDLIGIRALHLFKDEWLQIHEFITTTWALHEEPIAYIRSGDPKALTDAFTDAKFRVEEHPFGYRSIHYVIESRPAKYTQLAELQVRTIFEEGWSEIDHRIRYPRQSDDRYLAEFLTIFNRLAGSADEMGTFIKSLSAYITEQRQKLAAQEVEGAKREQDLKTAISKLKISESEKNRLQEQINKLRTPIFFDPAILQVSPQFASGLDLLKGIDFSSLGNISVFLPGLCSRCYSSFQPNKAEPQGDTLCPKCRGQGPARLISGS